MRSSARDNVWIYWPLKNYLAVSESHFQTKILFELNRLEFLFKFGAFVQLVFRRIAI